MSSPKSPVQVAGFQGPAAWHHWQVARNPLFLFGNVFFKNSWWDFLFWFWKNLPFWMYISHFIGLFFGTSQFLMGDTSWNSHETQARIISPTYGRYLGPFTNSSEGISFSVGVWGSLGYLLRVCGQNYWQPRKLTWLFQDVSPITNGDFPLPCLFSGAYFFFFALPHFFVTFVIIIFISFDFLFGDLSLHLYEIWHELWNFSLGKENAGMTYPIFKLTECTFIMAWPILFCCLGIPESKTTTLKTTHMNQTCTFFSLLAGECFQRSGMNLHDFFSPPYRDHLNGKEAPSSLWLPFDSTSHPPDPWGVAFPQTSTLYKGPLSKNGAFIRCFLDLFVLKIWQWDNTSLHMGSFSFETKKPMGGVHAR